MAKLKTRTNQPVIDEEGLLDYIAQDGSTTQIGGNLEVDGGINSQPVSTSIFALEYISGDYYQYRTPYSWEQIKTIINKNIVNGFYAADYYILKPTTIGEDIIVLSCVEFDLVNNRLNAGFYMEFHKDGDVVYVREYEL